MIADGREQVLSDGTHIYPATYFGPRLINWKETCFSEDTISIHWYTLSGRRYEWIRKVFGLKWYGDARRAMLFFRYPIRITCRKMLGAERYDRMKQLLKG